MRAVSAKDQMGMTIHQSGRDPPPRAVDPLDRVGVRWKVGTAACEGDAAVARGDQAVLDHTELGHTLPDRGEPGVVPDSIEALGHAALLGGRSLTYLYVYT